MKKTNSREIAQKRERNNKLCIFATMIYFPCAKINIGLNVTGLLPEGYHSIETLMYPLSLNDALEIREKTDGQTTLTVEGLEIKNTSCQDNLCMKAYRLLKQDYPQLPQVNMFLHKAIPMGAGLGGGSSDATFTIKLLDFVFSLHLSLQQIDTYASQLGADCAFFAYNIPLYAYERGNRFAQTTLSLKGKYILLVKPDVSRSTKEAYAEVSVQEKEISLLNTLESMPITQWKYFVQNDFEQSLFPHY